MINLTDRMIYRLGNLNTEQQRISYQMSTGKLLDRGSDDSSVFARELYVDDKIRVYEGIQSQIAKTTAQNVVSDSSMGEIKTLLDNVKQEMIKSLNAGMDADDKQAAAVGVTGMKENLLTLANEKVNGEYLFAGGDTTVRPFSKDSTTGVVTYNGDALSRQIAVEPNTYRDRGISGIDMMFYTADEQTGSNALDYEEKERVIDSSGLEWIKPLATTGNKLTFDVGDATGGNTLTDNTADTWTLDTTTNTITNSGSTLTLDVVNLEGDMWQTVGTIDDGTTITSLRSTTDAIGLRQMGAYGVLSGNDLEVASSTGTPVTYTTANVDTSGGYATGTTIASKHSIFEDIDAIISALNTNDNTAMNALLDNIDSSYDAANVAHSKLGGRSKIFELAEDSVASKLTHFNIMSQDVSGADLSKVAMEAKALEMTYTALYSTITKMNNLSLVNFVR